MAKLWYIGTMKYYSALKRNKILLQTTICMDFKAGGGHTECKKPVANGYILCDSNYIIFLELKKYIVLEYIKVSEV